MIEKLKDVKIPQELLSKWDFSGKHILDLKCRFWNKPATSSGEKLPLIPD